jgi:ABC-type glycerol-3-phosphate transport system substrate-binding protein
MRLKMPGHADYFLFFAALALTALLFFRFFPGRNPGFRGIDLVLAVMDDDEDLSVLAGKFMERNPGILIRIEKRTGDEIRRFMREVPEKGPDIVVLDDWQLREGIENSRLMPAAGEGSGETETQWAFPAAVFIDVLFYNTMILAAAGLDRPPADREEFLAAARAVASAGGVHAASLALSPEDPRSVFRDVFSWIWASGAGPGDLSADGESSELRPPGYEDGAGSPRERAAAALDFLARLSREGLLAPGTFTKTGAERLEEFAAGKIAMMTGSVKDIAFLEERMRGTLGVTRIPGPAEYAGRPVFALYGRYIGITAECSHPGEARSFLAFLAEEKFPAGLPGPAPENRTSPLYVKVADMYEAAGLVRGYANLERGAELEAALRQELVPLLEGRRNGADTADAAVKQWKKK